MPQNGGGKGWKWDEETGQHVMPKNWQKLLEWLLQGNEREPRTQRDWAAENKIHEDSIPRIKRDARINKEWDRPAAHLNIIRKFFKKSYNIRKQKNMENGVASRCPQNPSKPTQMETNKEIQMEATS